MKQVILIFSLILCLTCQAQFFQNHALYLTSGINTASNNYIGFSSSLQYVYKEKYALKYGSSSNMRVSATLPRDYSGGLFSFGKPKDQLFFKCVTIGRILKLKSTHLIRLNLAVGVAQIKEQTLTDWQSTYGGIFGANYTHKNKLTESTGVIVNPSLEFPLGRGIGISISSYAIFSNKLNSAGCSFNLMFGLLRGKHTRK